MNNNESEDGGGEKATKVGHDDGGDDEEDEEEDEELGECEKSTKVTNLQSCTLLFLKRSEILILGKWCLRTGRRIVQTDFSLSDQRAELRNKVLANLGGGGKGQDYRFFN